LRRSDREVTGLENILAILDKCEVMRVGMCVEDQPYIVPMNFAYEVIDGKVSIYFHCAPEGKKLDMISKNNHVCFEADCSHKILKADSAWACEWSAEFQSVMGEGKIAAVTGEPQKIAALDLIMKRYGFQGKPAYRSQKVEAVTILKISVASITGKSKQIG